MEAEFLSDGTLLVKSESQAEKIVLKLWLDAHGQRYQENPNFRIEGLKFKALGTVQEGV